MGTIACSHGPQGGAAGVAGLHRGHAIVDAAGRIVPVSIDLLRNVDEEVRPTSTNSALTRKVRGTARNALSGRAAAIRICGPAS